MKINFFSELSLLYITKMFNLDNIANENNKEHNQKWPYIPQHSYRILIIGGPGSGKTNALLNVIKEQGDIDNICMRKIFPKYKFLIKRSEDTGIKYLNDLNAFIECSNTLDDVYEDIDDYNLNIERQKFIVFDGMIADIMSNKEFQAAVIELFFGCRKLNTSLVFITQFYFSVVKDVKINSAHYLIMKINKERELQHNAIDHSADID